MSEVIKESKLRSVLKAISWRLIATGTTFLLALFVFRESKDALEKSIEIINKRYNKEIINSNWHNEYSNTIKSHSSNSILGCFMYIVFDFVVTLILNTHIFWRRLKNKNYTD